MSNSVDPDEREHVTLGVYRRPERFVLKDLFGDEDYSAYRWTVDNQGDLEFVKSVYEHLYPDKPDFEFEDVGVDIDYSCRVGTCGVCKVKLLSGAVTMEIDA